MKIDIVRQPITPSLYDRLTPDEMDRIQNRSQHGRLVLAVLRDMKAEDARQGPIAALVLDGLYMPFDVAQAWLINYSQRP